MPMWERCRAIKQNLQIFDIYKFKRTYRIKTFHGNNLILRYYPTELRR